MAAPNNELSLRWDAMELEKGDLVERSREYARWTIPSVLPDENSDGQERKSSVEIGATVVNHLSNRIVDVLFPIARPFFTVVLNDDTQIELEKEMGKADAGKMRETIHDAMRKIENKAMTTMNLSVYRPMAIEIAKHLIVTGNAMMRRMKDGTRIQYGIDRYCLARTAVGKVHEVLLKDVKMFSAFSEAVQAEIKAVHPSMKADDKITLLTHYKLTKGRWHIRQEADGVMIGKATWQSEADFDLIPLVWNLAHNESYGRGLVEDKAASFHKIDVLSECETELFAIISDVKLLVRPNSVLAMQLDSLRDSDRGSYHLGNEGDITVPQWGKQYDLSLIAQAIAASEAKLKEAFLVANVRDAERVTAEEIRMIANQLESSFGGLYSRLSVQWQQPEAELALEESKWQTLVTNTDIFDVIVTTGVESLSREGQTDNLRMAIGDMQMLDAVPEELRRAFHPLRFAKFVAANRSVNVLDFLKTEEEMQQDQQREQDALAQQAQAQAQAQAGGKVAEHAGKSAVDGA